MGIPLGNVFFGLSRRVHRTPLDWREQSGDLFLGAEGCDRIGAALMPIDGPCGSLTGVLDVVQPILQIEDYPLLDVFIGRLTVALRHEVQGFSQAKWSGRLISAFIALLSVA